MKIYRGIQDLLYKQIDHNFINTDLTFCEYGPGTSYAYHRTLTEDYVQGCNQWSWLVTASFNSKNPLYITPAQMKDPEDMDEGFLLNGVEIARNDISTYAQSVGHDCIVFQYHDSDPHILLLPKSSAPEIESVELYTEKQLVVNKLKKLKLYFDGTNYQVPLNKIKLVDELLSELD